MVASVERRVLVVRLRWEMSARFVVGVWDRFLIGVLVHGLDVDDFGVVVGLFLGRIGVGLVVVVVLVVFYVFDFVGRRLLLVLLVGVLKVVVFGRKGGRLERRIVFVIWVSLQSGLVIVVDVVVMLLVDVDSGIGLVISIYVLVDIVFPFEYDLSHQGRNYRNDTVGVSSGAVWKRMSVIER